MRYHYSTSRTNNAAIVFGQTYICNHPVYNSCTLIKIGDLGLAIVQQRFDPKTKSTYWSPIDPWLCNDIYLHNGFLEYFKKYARKPENGLYPTVPVRKIMWALRMKPLKKKRWETTFDRKEI